MPATMETTTTTTTATAPPITKAINVSKVKKVKRLPNLIQAKELHDTTASSSSVPPSKPLGTLLPLSLLFNSQK
jgi:hypothetical protein